MDPETEKIIKTQIKKLPDEIRMLFTDSGLGDKILNIGRKNGIINIEQLGIFQTETNLVMLGLVHPDDYPNELRNQLNLSEEKVNNIVNDINEQILKGIREKLKEIYEKTDEIPDEVEESRESEKEKGESLGNSSRTVLGNKQGEPLENFPRVPLGNSILEQKLSGTFQIPKTETDHSLTNISKDTKPKIPQTDPYREIPE